MKRFISPAELSRRYDINVNTIYRLVRQGEIPAMKLGRRTLRIDEDDIEHWVHSRREINERN